MGGDIARWVFSLQLAALLLVTAGAKLREYLMYFFEF
jgi:hypothetical protein